jgi:hypothetical protein
VKYGIKFWRGDHVLVYGDALSPVHKVWRREAPHFKRNSGCPVYTTQDGREEGAHTALAVGSRDVNYPHCGGTGREGGRWQVSKGRPSVVARH